MSWKGHTKKTSVMREKNLKLDMETMNRLREILEEIKDQDTAIEFGFLKEYLRLRTDDMEAMDELKIKLADVGEISFSSIVDETDQKIYLSFFTPE